MEQRTIRLNFDLSFVYGPRTWRLPMVAVMMMAAVGELNSESVTLSTYYPAPSGVYTNMITTNDTFMARDVLPVARVTDGTFDSRVALGTTLPTQKLSVVGNINLTGRIGIGRPVTWGLLNVAAPTEALDIWHGNIRVEGDPAAGQPKGYIHLNAVGCAPSAPVANAAICAAGQYATFQAGVYTEGWSYQNMPAPFLITPSLTRIYQFVGINPAGGQSSAMAFGYTEAISVACCPKT